MSTTSQTLMEFYDAMRKRFGHQGWWPGQTPLEICVGAILTQNTNWANVEKAIANLKAADCMSVSALHAAPASALAKLLRPAGYFNIKARRLKNFIAHVQRTHGGDLGGPGADLGGPGADLGGPGGSGRGFLDRPVPTLREELLSINGIGRETADSIILYAACKPAFVVDAYTYRVLLRHSLIAPEDDYESIKELLESHLPTDVGLWNDFHAQFVAVGKNHCRPAARCEGCPLEPYPHDRGHDRVLP